MDSDQAPAPAPAPAPDQSDFFPDPAPPAATYLLKHYQGVWSLRRSGRLLMRSRDRLRVERALASAAIEEAAESGRDVLARKLDEDGADHTLTFTAAKARVILDRPACPPYAEGGGS